MILHKFSNMSELEEQRIGKNKNTAINHTYILGGEYRRKFDFISSEPSLNKLLYQLAKKMLIHRSGTRHEDMYWIDGKVYMYTANERINETYYNLVVVEYLKHGYNEDEAQKKALNEIQNNFDIKFREVTDNGSI